MIYSKSVIFSGTSASSTIKTHRHDITDILLKVALNSINLSQEFCPAYRRARYTIVDHVDHGVDFTYI